MEYFNAVNVYIDTIAFETKKVWSRPNNDLDIKHRFNYTCV